jgi:hypothetical protein
MNALLDILDLVTPVEAPRLGRVYRRNQEDLLNA